MNTPDVDGLVTIGSDIWTVRCRVDRLRSLAHRGTMADASPLPPHWMQSNAPGDGNLVLQGALQQFAKRHGALTETNATVGLVLVLFIRVGLHPWGFTIRRHRDIEGSQGAGQLVDSHHALGGIGILAQYADELPGILFEHDDIAAGRGLEGDQ